MKKEMVGKKKLKQGMQAVVRHCRDIVHFSASEKQWQGCKHKSFIR